MARKQPNLTDMVAMMIIVLPDWDLSFEDTQKLSNKAIIAHYRKTHDIHHWTTVAVLCGTNHATNMSWMACPTHDERTRKIDVPNIAKLKRSERKRTNPKPKQKIKSRGFPDREERERLKQRYGRPS